MNNLASMRNCPGVQGRLNWTRVYSYYHPLRNVVSIQSYIFFVSDLNLVDYHILLWK